MCLGRERKTITEKSIVIQIIDLCILIVVEFGSEKYGNFFINFIFQFSQALHGRENTGDCRFIRFCEFV